MYRAKPQILHREPHPVLSFLRAFIKLYMRQYQVSHKVSCSHLTMKESISKMRFFTHQGSANEATKSRRYLFLDSDFLCRTSVQLQNTENEYWLNKRNETWIFSYKDALKDFTFTLNIKNGNTSQKYDVVPILLKFIYAFRIQKENRINEIITRTLQLLSSLLTNIYGAMFWRFILT